MGRSKDGLLSSLDEWERDHPGEEFQPALDQFRDELSKGLSSISLADIRRKRNHYARHRAALLTGHPELQRVSSLSPVRRAGRELALCEAFVEAAETEIARRSRRTSTVAVPSLSVQRETRQKGEVRDPDVAKRKLLVKHNVGIKASELCAIFDRECVPVPTKWSAAGFDSWSRAYKNAPYKPRIEVLISKDRRSC